MNIKSVSIILSLAFVAFALMSNSTLQSNNNFMEDYFPKDSLKKINLIDTSVIGGFGDCSKPSVRTTASEAMKMMLNLDVCVQDKKTNESLPIKRFDITYAERAIVEDSTGYPHATVEYSFDEMTGSKLDKNWQTRLKESLYKGDTIIISNITATRGNKVIKAPNKIVIGITE